MNHPIAIFTDIHGAFLTFQALLAQVHARFGPETPVYLLGDLIDRGPRSREMVEWAMRTKTPTVKGNHEDMALAYSAHSRLGYRAKCARYYDRDVWLDNGGYECLGSWKCQMPDMTLPRDVLDWMDGLPPYIIPDVAPDENGRKLFLSHTGYGFSADKGDWLTTLWGRHGYDRGNFPSDGYYRVIGHTKQKKARVTQTYANIDTGAAYAGHHLMSALIWPSKEVLTQKYID